MSNHSDKDVQHLAYPQQRGRGGLPVNAFPKNPWSATGVTVTGHLCYSGPPYSRCSKLKLLPAVNHVLISLLYECLYFSFYPPIIEEAVDCIVEVDEYLSITVILDWTGIRHSVDATVSIIPVLNAFSFLLRKKILIPFQTPSQQLLVLMGLLEIKVGTFCTDVL